MLRFVFIYLIINDASIYYTSNIAPRLKAQLYYVVNELRTSAISDQHFISLLNDLSNIFTLPLALTIITKIVEIINVTYYVIIIIVFLEVTYSSWLSMIKRIVWCCFLLQFSSVAIRIWIDMAAEVGAVVKCLKVSLQAVVDKPSISRHR